MVHWCRRSRSGMFTKTLQVESIALGFEILLIRIRCNDVGIESNSHMKYFTIVVLKLTYVLVSLGIPYLLHILYYMLFYCRRKIYLSGETKIYSGSKTQKLQIYYYYRNINKWNKMFGRSAKTKHMGQSRKILSTVSLEITTINFKTFLSIKIFNRKNKNKNVLLVWHLTSSRGGDPDPEALTIVCHWIYLIIVLMFERSTKKTRTI